MATQKAMAARAEGPLLRPGAHADVLVADGDVTADVAALGRPAAVFQGGRQVR